ncbi:hypothetical protein Tco_0320560 [Tanacetum coccineum]
MFVFDETFLLRYSPFEHYREGSDDEFQCVLFLVSSIGLVDMPFRRLHIPLRTVDPGHSQLLLKQSTPEITPEGIELILWGDLKIMMESLTEENDQELKDGTVIHMLIERRYPLSKELLQRMLDLGLEVERESTTAIHLVRFIKQQLNEE